MGRAYQRVTGYEIIDLPRYGYQAMAARDLANLKQYLETGDVNRSNPLIGGR